MKILTLTEILNFEILKDKLSHIPRQSALSILNCKPKPRVLAPTNFIKSILNGEVGESILKLLHAYFIAPSRKSIHAQNLSIALVLVGATLFNCHFLCHDLVKYIWKVGS